MINFNKRLLRLYLRAKHSALEVYSKYHHMEVPPGESVVVLSPHPDDDVFGCGGVIQKHLNRGHRVSVVYLCNGCNGIKGASKQEAAGRRTDEARSALAVLGVRAADAYFMGVDDDRLKVTKPTIAKLGSILSEISPDLIYVPSFTDNHSDHYQTNLLLKQVGIGPCTIAGYEIWTPHIPNRIVDISDEVDRKIKAMREHGSQLNELNYLDGIVSLNRYRACMYPKQRFAYAESFLVLNSSDYFGLF